jgi:hypothetical protein
MTISSEYFKIFCLILLTQNNFFRSKFLQYGNEILAAIVLVTCPCDLLFEQLQDIVQSSARLLTKMNWLNIIRPDWFDTNYEMRSQAQTFFAIKNIVETRQNNFPVDTLVSVVLENAELNSCRLGMIPLIMKYEQWGLLNLFFKREHDWSFLNNKSIKVKTRRL